MQNISFAYNFQSALNDNEIIYKSSTYKINIINPSIQNNKTGSSYPGYRGANQLIIYTPTYGRKTGTNEFGTEAIIENGYATSLSGANSLIPNNGFVISGHGKAKEWINQNVIIGSKIVVNTNDMTITSYLTPDSLFFSAKEKIKEVFGIMKFYANQENVDYDYTSSLEYLNKSQKALIKASKNQSNSQKYSSIAIQNANKALEYSIPYYENELKGVWIRPVEKNQSEIENTLDKLKDAGINTIFLETFYHSKTIYPSEVLAQYKVTNQRQEFVGFDPLRIWIEQAHKRKMRINVWFECFYVGNDNPQINPMHVLNVYPQWANLTREKYNSSKPVPSISEHNGYFLDPANPMVQKYLLDIIDEIVTKYQPDGINLDYIRYPQTITKQTKGYENANWGYTQYARDEFKSMYNIDPITISKNTPEWNLWAKYRQNKVSDFVRQVGQNVRKKAQLTAVIFPDRQNSLDIKMQDWQTWSLNNYVDGFTPLLLSCDYETAKGLLNDIKQHSSYFTDIYAGIFVSFMNGSTDDLLKQIHMARQLNTNGVIIFEYSHFAQKYIDALSTSAFKPLSTRTQQQINSGEISKQNLNIILDEAISNYYKSKISSSLQQDNTKNVSLKRQRKKQKAIFAPEHKNIKKGRFF